MLMRHPEVDADPVETTDEAYAATWQERGWVRSDGAQLDTVVAEVIAEIPGGAEPSPAIATHDLEGLSKPELVVVGTRIGLSVSERMSKPELIDAVRAAGEVV